MKLTKDDLRIVNGVAAETSRPVLGHVLLRRGKLAVADGFLLVVKDADFEEGDGLAEEEEVLLPPDMLSFLKPGKSEHVRVKMESPFDDISATISATIIGANNLPKDPTLHFFPGRVGEHTFPKYEQVIGSPGKKAVTAVDVNLLRKLLKCLPERGTLKIRVGEMTQPIEFCFTNALDRSDIRAFVMPMFVNVGEQMWAEDDPTWKKKEADVGGSHLAEAED